MKKNISLISLLIFISIFTGCASKEGEKVYVYNWGDYIDLETISLFEEETGIKVVYDEFQTNEEMFPKIQSRAVSFDVVCPSDYMIQKMIENDLLQELNFDNIPNLKYIDPSHLENSEEFDPGNKYSVPYCWGTLGILYNKTMVDEPVDSWGILFDEKYSGEILMIDSVRDAFAISLQYLGYDLNSTNETELEEAKQLLQKQYPLVQAYVVDQVRDKMIGKEAAIGVIYSGEAIFTKRENPNLEYVVPQEGSNVWIDGWVIPNNSKNKENAEAFINFMCKPEIALMNFDFITYSTPNLGAWDLIEDEEIKNSTIAFPSKEILDRCTAFRYLGEEMENIYMNKWNEKSK
jgi:spermidine/putrescine-binding protein